jgi:hypothetical protein
VEAHLGALDQGKLLIKLFIKISEKYKFIKGFLLNRGRNVGFHLKSWGFLKNFKTRSGSFSGLGLYVYVIKRN